MPKGLKILSIISSLCMLFVLIGGALVTKTGSGQGCGRSWPLCNGEFVPSNITPELIIELSHRLVSGFCTILIVWLAIWSWRRLGHVKEVKFLSILSVLFLVIQALMGAGAVVFGQDPVIMALHFGISLVSFASVFILTLIIFEVDIKFNANKLVINKKIRTQIWSISLYSYFVIFTGALVRHKKASLACLEFPLCNNDNLGLPTTSYEYIQMGHRAAAIVLFIWILVFAIQVIKNYKDQTALYLGAVTSLVLITLQFISGVLSIYTLINLYVALMHALFISILFGVFCYLMLLASRSKKNEDKKEEVA